jgi:hypothetical protein
MMDEPIWEMLPVERCACGLVSRGLVTGECADCREKSGARPVVDLALTNMKQEPPE